MNIFLGEFSLKRLGDDYLVYPFEYLPYGTV